MARSAGPLRQRASCQAGQPRPANADRQRTRAPTSRPNRCSLQMEKRIARLGMDEDGWQRAHAVLDRGLRLNPGLYTTHPPLTLRTHTLKQQRVLTQPPGRTALASPRQPFTPVTPSLQGAPAWRRRGACWSFRRATCGPRSNCWSAASASTPPTPPCSSGSPSAWRAPACCGVTGGVPAWWRREPRPPPRPLAGAAVVQEQGGRTRE